MTVDSQTPGDERAPTVAGYRVAPMALSDADDWAEWVSRPDVTRFTSSIATSVADLLPMIERTLAGTADAPYLFTVREPGSGRLVASLGFHTVSALNRTAEVTYAVSPAEWGKGLATSACAAAVAWGFRHRQWVRIQATTLEAHLASRRVLGKCGFALEGTVRNFRIVRGEPRDYLLFSIIPPRPDEHRRVDG